MLVKTLLIFLVTIICNADWFFGTSQLSRPIVAGTLTGLVLGDLQAGIIMGATLELAFIGAVSIGAYDPPDMTSGTILGVAFAIQAGAGAEAALTLGIPIATIMLTLNMIIHTPALIFVSHRCDAAAEKGNHRAISWWALLGPWIIYGSTFILVPIAFYFGSDAVTGVLGNIPEFIQTGMEIATGLIPALGFAMLAQMIMNKKVAPYFFLGYFAVQYFGISTTGVAIFAAIIAAIYFFTEQDKQEKQLATTGIADERADSGGDFDEF